MRILSFFLPIFYFFKTYLKVLILLAVVCFGFFFVLLAAIELYYSHRIFPRVYFGDLFLGGKRLDEAHHLVETVFAQRLHAELVYVLNNEQRISLGRVGDFASYDVSATVARAYSVGRVGNLWNRIVSRIHLLRYGAHIAPVYAYNRHTFERTFHDLFYRYEKPAVNSSLIYRSGTIILSESVSGSYTDFDVAIGEFERYLSLQRPSSVIPVRVLLAFPSITQENTQDALEKARLALEREFIFSTPRLPGSTWRLRGEELARLFDLHLTEHGVDVRVTDYKVASWSAQIASLLNRDPIDAKFEFDGHRVKEFAPAAPGLALDTSTLTQRIQDHAFNMHLPNTIEIPVVEIAPALSIENVNTYGIKELVGQGTSKFIGSSSGRVHNIQLGSSKLHGVLIAPDEVFSMHRVVGEVEKATGYQDAFIIKNGRTVPGVGGGLCQVSTTLFRAVLHAGLPILERHQHAYRVHYYEMDSPPGVDAAVYFPSLDFKFKNDTGHYLLLQTKIDTKRMIAEFNLYGVKDGRSVVLSKPVISNQTPPPSELRIDDPTLPRGQEKVVEHAVWGADVVFTRRVTKDGKELFFDTFQSSYTPWRRIVMVGVKD